MLGSVTILRKQGADVVAISPTKLLFTSTEDFFTTYIQNGVTAVDMATVGGRRDIAEIFSEPAEQQQATPTQSSMITSSSTAKMTAGHTTTELTSELPPTQPSPGTPDEVVVSVDTEQALRHLPPSTSPPTPLPSHPTPSTSPPTPVPSHSPPSTLPLTPSSHPPPSTSLSTPLPLPSPFTSPPTLFTSHPPPSTSPPTPVAPPGTTSADTSNQPTSSGGRSFEVCSCIDKKWACRGMRIVMHVHCLCMYYGTGSEESGEQVSSENSTSLL